MIFVQSLSDQNVFVGTSGGEFAMTNATTAAFGSVSYVSVGVGAHVPVTVSRDGAVVLVDVGGRIAQVDGPDLVGAGVWGFGLAVSTVGMILGIRWSVSKILSGAHLGPSSVGD